MLVNRHLRLCRESKRSCPLLPIGVSKQIGEIEISQGRKQAFGWFDCCLRSPTTEDKELKRSVLLALRAFMYEFERACNGASVRKGKLLTNTFGKADHPYKQGMHLDDQLLFDAVKPVLGR